MGTVHTIENHLTAISRTIRRVLVSYSERQNIQKKRKLIDKVSLTETQKQEIKEFFRKNYGKSLSTAWHRLYQSYRHILQRLFPRNSIFDTIGAETQSIQRSRNIGRQKFFAAIVLRNRRPSHPPNLSILRKRHIQKREQCSVIPSRSLYVIIRPRQMRGEKDDRHQ